MKTSTRKLTLSALFLALGLVLPLITGQIPQIGKMLLPMHIPVLLGLGGNGFTMQMFIAGAFATALPGIVLQLVLIPVVMVGLEHAGVLRDTV